MCNHDIFICLLQDLLEHENLICCEFFSTESTLLPSNILIVCIWLQSIIYFICQYLICHIKECDCTLVIIAELISFLLYLCTNHPEVLLLSKLYLLVDRSGYIMLLNLLGRGAILVSQKVAINIATKDCPCSQYSYSFRQRVLACQAPVYTQIRQQDPLPSLAH